MKKILWLFIILAMFFGFSFAKDYVYFYMQWCQHCAKVEKYFEDNDLIKKYNIQEKEIRFDQNNLQLLMQYYDKLWTPEDQRGSVPFLVVDWWEACTAIQWDTKIIDYFKNIEKNSWDAVVCQSGSNSGSIIKDIFSKNSIDKLPFFGLLIPAAISDSINPCAFTVMLLLLWAILTKHKKLKTVFLSWSLFVLAVFVSYFLMGLGLYKALATATNTFYLKLVVWIIWVLIWLANIKDYFWYGEGFVMEVPFARRPTMKKIIESVVSPRWAFVVWIIVSLFLLPCTSGPYFTVLGYLASQDKNLTTWWYIYLFIYNLIFVLPMIAITFLVWLWFKKIDDLAKFKENNKLLIHLIVWILMLWLGGYVLLSAYGIDLFPL